MSFFFSSFFYMSLSHEVMKSRACLVLGICADVGCPPSCTIPGAAPLAEELAQSRLFQRAGGETRSPEAPKPRSHYKDYKA